MGRDMNGLNRYDGYEFKIYQQFKRKSAILQITGLLNSGKTGRGFIWLETYDGYYHFFNPESEVFTSIPYYDGRVKNGAMQFFLQYFDEIILLGSSVSGLYYLKYDPSGKTYRIKSVYPDIRKHFV